jgi:hypothetical protein
MPKAPALSDAGGAPGGLRLCSVSSTPVEVPLHYVLGTNGATERAAPLLLVKALTGQGWPITDRPGSRLDWELDAAQRHRID